MHIISVSPRNFLSLIISYLQGEIGENSELGEEHKYEITESMRREMEYDADRAWYLDLVIGSIFLSHLNNFFLYLMYVVLKLMLKEIKNGYIEIIWWFVVLVLYKLTLH